MKTDYEIPDQTLSQLYRNSLLRPLNLLHIHPSIQSLALFYAFLYGLMYLVLSTFTTPWQERYHQPTDPASLHYLAPGAGCFRGSQVSGSTITRMASTVLAFQID
jgi:hypothetical protein